MYAISGSEGTYMLNLGVKVHAFTALFSDHDFVLAKKQNTGVYMC